MSSNSFARRVGYYPMNVEEDVTPVEREYLMGGKGIEVNGSKSKAAKASDSTRYQLNFQTVSLIEDDPMTSASAYRLTFWSNFMSLLFGGALLAVCIYEGRDSRNADENCPLLQIGIGVSGLVMFNALVGLMAHTRQDFTFGMYMYNTNLVFSLLSLVLNILFAIAVLVHWDIDGQPSHNLFFPVETVGVRHRYFIWGAALAIALNMTVTIYGILSIAHRYDWPNHDDVFRQTLRFSSFVILVTGIGLLCAGGAVWWKGEISKLSHPVWVLASMASGFALLVVAIMGLRAHKSEQLSHFLIWLPLISLCVIIFSLGNAVTAEPGPTSQRRTYVLISALIGLWGQINTIVAITAASNWRFNLKLNEIVPP